MNRRIARSRTIPKRMMIRISLTSNFSISRRSSGRVAMNRTATLVAVLALAGVAAGQAAAGKPQAAAGQPAGRPPVQAKSQDEYQAYQTAVSNTQNPAAMEKAADDFAAKFPA